MRVHDQPLSATLGTQLCPRNHAAMAKPAPDAFRGFSPQALKFLRELFRDLLKKNNDRAWFAPKELYAAHREASTFT